jgi:endo-1,4-beta-D-glucanase Y
MRTTPSRQLLTVLALLVACADPPPDRDAGKDDDTRAESTEGDAGTSASLRDAGGASSSQQDASRDASASEQPPTQKPGTGAGAFPFPQNRALPHCTLPASDDTQVKAAWDKWRAQAVVSAGAGGFLRVRRWENADDTVSEGIGYGMIAAVYFNDQDTFDELFQYSQLHLDNNGFMHWRVDAQGREIDGNGGMVALGARSAASDADEDIAWALVMAHSQWGAGGALDDDYIALARGLIDKIYRFEVDHAGGEILKPGDTWGGASVTNPSYFAPSYYRVFGRVTGKVAEWNKVIDATYKTLAAAANSSTGLVPAWCKADGSNAGKEYYYQYDACRTPFRIALDYCQNGEPRAESYLKKVGTFFQGVGARNIKDGYELNGTPRSKNASAAFAGPAGVAGLVSADLMDFTNDAYTELLVLGQQQPGQGYSYYNSSWHLLSLLMLSGNYLDYSSL